MGGSSYLAGNSQRIDKPQISPLKNLYFLTMATAALNALKAGGVWVTSQDAADPATRDWHDLTTLKPLDAKAQLALTAQVKPYLKLVTESIATHTGRIRGRFRGETLRMLVKAERHWRETQGLPAVEAMEKYMSNVSMAVLFELFSSSFGARMKVIHLKNCSRMRKARLLIRQPQ